MFNQSSCSIRLNYKNGQQSEISSVNKYNTKQCYVYLKVMNLSVRWSLLIFVTCLIQPDRRPNPWLTLVRSGGRLARHGKGALIVRLVPRGVKCAVRSAKKVLKS